MSRFVTTRLSLLLRIRDSQDAQSWSDFVHLYAPIVYRCCRHAGLQDADASDVTQEVLTSVLESIGSFEYDRKIGRFRGWLKTIAYRACCSLKQRQRRNRASTGSEAFESVVPNVEAESEFAVLG